MNESKNQSGILINAIGRTKKSIIYQVSIGVIFALVFLYLCILGFQSYTDGQNGNCRWNTVNEAMQEVKKYDMGAFLFRDDLISNCLNTTYVNSRYEKLILILNNVHMLGVNDVNITALSDEIANMNIVIALMSIGLDVNWSSNVLMVLCAVSSRLIMNENKQLVTILSFAMNFFIGTFLLGAHFFSVYYKKYPKEVEKVVIVRKEEKID